MSFRIPNFNQVKDWAADRTGIHRPEDAIGPALVIGGAALAGPAGATAAQGAVGASMAAGGAAYMGQTSANQANRDIAAQANTQSQANAREQMAFQERLSNTSYGRSMEDMRRAGLNPMLAFSQGGASSPSGASGSVATAKMENALAPAISSALEARRLRKDIEATDSQVKLNGLAGKTQVETAKLTAANARVAEKRDAMLDAQMPAVKAQAKYEQQKAEMDSEFVKVDSWIDRLGRVLGGASAAKSLITPKFKPNNKKTVIDGNTGEILHESIVP